MSKQLLFYADVAPVNKSKHAELSVKTAGDYSFTQSVNSVPLTAIEIPKAVNDYAVVFAGTDEQIMPMVILGTNAEENLYYSDESGWQADYIPAFVRRYPFVFSTSDNGENFTLCIDENFSGCNYEGKGERLFDSEGERTQFLANTIEFLKEYQAQFQRTKAFCNRLKALELFEPMHAQFSIPGGERRALTGFYVVNKAKLKELTDEQVLELAKNDSLELIYLHLQSLQNFPKIAKKAPRISKEEQSAEAVSDVE